MPTNPAPAYATAGYGPSADGATYASNIDAYNSGRQSPGLSYALSSAVGMLGTGMSAYSQSQAIAEAGKARQHTFQVNQQLAQVQAQEALTRGDWIAQQQGRAAAQRQGARRVATAASGVQVDTGSSAQTQASDAGQNALDQVVTRTNAWREAWGYKEQALNYGYEADMAGLSSKYGSNMTLLTGGLDMLRQGGGDFDAWNRPRLPNSMGGANG